MKCYSFPFSAMGSSCEIKLYSVTQDIAYDVAKLIINLVNSLEQRYSRYLEHNLLYEINKAAKVGGCISVDEETAALLSYAESCFNNSNGLFDISSGILRKSWDFKSNKLPNNDLVDSLLDRVGWDKVIWKAQNLSFNCQGMELDFGGLVKEYAADQSAVIFLQTGIQHGLVNLCKPKGSNTATC